MSTYKSNIINSTSMSDDDLNYLRDSVSDHETESLASDKYEKIIDEIADFENELDNEHEIALKLASFGSSITMNVISIGFQNPDILCFYGYVNNKYSQLIQHMSQLNFLMTSVERQDKSKPARRIGFQVPDDKS